MDWWVFYKLPQQVEYPSVDRGYAYVYRTSRTPEANILSKWPINSPNSVLYKTIHKLTNENRGVEYYSFNDAYGTDGNSAHAKGLAVFPSEGGYWITHTVPFLMPVENNSPASEYPDTQPIFGQTGICVSLGGSSDPRRSDLINRLCHMNILHYTGHGSPCKTGAPPDEQHNYDFFYERGRHKFRFFSQLHGAKNEDIYTKFVKGNPDSNHMFVQSFLRNNIMLGNSYVTNSICSAMFARSETAQINAVWKSTVDHAKITKDKSKLGYYCFGDLNRETTQLVRGGGLICFQLHGNSNPSFVDLRTIVCPSVMDDDVIMLNGTFFYDPYANYEDK